MTNLAVITLLILTSLLAVRLFKKYDISWNCRRMFFPHMHESVVQRWIDNKLRDEPVRAVFTEKAIEFIRANSEKEFSLLITLSRQFIGANRKGLFSLPRPVVELAVADPTEDSVKLESNTGISVLVAREIYEVLKKEKVSLIVATSGFWKFRRLELRPDISWLLYSSRLRELPSL